MDRTLPDRVMGAIWPAGGSSEASVWAILDGARDPRIHQALKTSRLDYRCLYSGRLPEALEAAAPHLVEVSRTYAFTRQLVEAGWGNSWGVFVRTRDAANLRHHLRTFLRVRDESGRILFFRYYDPRVLRAYLPTCELDELKAVFGPIESYLVESEDGRNLIEFAFDGMRLQERRVSLSSASAEPAPLP